MHYFGSAVSAGRLTADSDALAAALAADEVGAGERVAVLLQNQPSFVVVALAVWKLGAVLVPVNPMFRADELRKQLDDADVRALVYLDALGPIVAEAVGDDGPRLIATGAADYLEEQAPVLLRADEPVRGPEAERLDVLIERFAGQRPERPAVLPGDVAILAYTSGTTGPPKGAMLTHANVLNNVATVARWRQLDEHERLLAMSPLFHVTGLVLHLSMALVVGMPLVLGFRFDPETVLELIESHQVTYTTAAVTAYIALLEHPTFAPARVRSLVKTVSGGAPTPPAVVERFEAATGCYLSNGYGLTETASPSHQVPMGRRAPVHPSSGSIAIGVPIPGVDCRLVDDAGRDVAPGEPGELVIRGPNVIAGYWQRPEESAAALADGYVRTGDVAEVDDQGWFYLVDRKKDQINASGFKVWPLEVEQVLYAHPAVSEAAVIGVPDGYRGETVKAYVVLRDGADVDTASLIEFCRERMAAYKYPRQVEFLDELPKSPSGKVLRRVLRDRPDAH